MKINESVKAVVLGNGTIQCLTTNKSAAKRAVVSATYQGHNNPKVVDVLLLDNSNTVSKIFWHVKAEDNRFQEYKCENRRTARHLKKIWAESKLKSTITRKEYILVKEEIVS